MSGYQVTGFSVEPPYHMTLMPTDADDIRRSWEFRCDTLAEIDDWTGAFTKLNEFSAAFDG